MSAKPSARALGPLASVALAYVTTTVIVTVVSYRAPEAYAATAVGLVFLGATWLLVLRRDSAQIRHHGLSLGGLLEPEPLEPTRLARSAAVALAWALGCFAVVAPPFWLGFRMWAGARGGFSLSAALPSLDQAMGQLVVIALPEEAFFRGYVQTRLDEVFPKTVRVFGFPVGASIVVTSALFAIGHVLTIPSPERLAVFFPSLLFGSLRSRTKGIGASVVLHALFNLLSGALGRGYGVHP
ncbi:MAG: CPBP family intramembrane metalloprotease [Myxococcales bacterium]|nr:CPBP family intramembrane metalloprotease [Myxococcales bacterium]